MLTKRWSLLALVLIATVAVWGCSDDETTPTTPQVTAFEAMAGAGVAYINDDLDAPGVMSAQALNDNLANYTVIDIRQLVDYDAGHITGAYHSTLATLLTDLEMTIPSDKPYVVACYTGQSAGHAKIAMELLGYTDVKSLKFGMSAWNSSLDKWTVNCADNLPLPVDVTDNNPSMTDHGFPNLGTATVRSRVEMMLQNGFKGKSFNDIRDNLDQYFILNYFGRDDYMGTGTAGVPGHITGAFQFTPYSTLGINQMLKKLPTNKPIIVYCWTGQHSSQVTAYLNMLGYDAYSLKFGSNNLFHTDLTGHKWTAAALNDFPIVPTPTM